MAKIEIWTKDIHGGKFEVPGVIDPQHLYLIYTDDQGQREILRGGPGNNGLGTFGLGESDLLVSRQDYNSNKQSDRQTDTFDWNLGDGTHTSNVLVTGSETELSSLWDTMWQEGQRINSEGYDYELFTQNSNTAVVQMAAAVSLDAGVRDFIGKNDLDAPANAQEFQHSYVESLYDWLTEERSSTGESDTWSTGNWDATPNSDVKVLSDGRLSIQMDNPLFDAVESIGGDHVIAEGLLSKGLDVTGITFQKKSTYTIQPSDTLGQIAQEHGVTVDQLMEWNPDITDPDQILSGDSISVAEPEVTRSYTVVRDEKGRLGGSLEKLMSEDAPGIIKVTDQQGGSVLLVDDNANIDIKNGRTMPLSDLVDKLKPAVTVLSKEVIEIAGEYAKVMSNYLPNMIADLALGKNMDEVVEEYSARAAVELGVNRLFDMFDGAPPPAIDPSLADTAQRTSFLQTPAGQAVQQATIQFAVTAIMYGKDMDGSDYATAAANASVQSYARYEIGKTAWGGNSGSITPAGAGAIAAVTAFAVSLFDDGKIDGDDVKNIAVATGAAMIGSAVSGAIIGAMGGAAAGSVVPIIGTAIGFVVGYFFSSLFGGGSLPDPPPLFKVEPLSAGQIVYSMNSGRTLISRDGYDDAAVGTNGSETLVGSDGNNELYGFAGNDFLQGRDGDDSLFGGEGDDTVTGGSGDDVVVGDAGNDILEGNDGDDIMSGGDGNDVIYGDSEHAVNGTDDGDDIIDAGQGDDRVYAGGGDDQVSGNQGDDVLLGEAGNDSIDAGTGDDIVDGGDGDDVLSGGQDGVLVTDADGENAGFQAIVAAQATLASDTATNAEKAEAQQLLDDTELSGNDTLTGGSGNDRMFGYSGNDHLDGGAGDDVILAGYGDDTVIGGDGNDVIMADDDQSMYVDATGSKLPGQYNAAFVNGNDTIDAGAGDDVVQLIDGVDTVNLGSGNDQLESLLGTATVMGGSGDDEMTAYGGMATFHGEEGNDTLTSHGGSDQLYGGSGDDTLTAGLGDDSLDGGSGNDILSAEDGNNQLDGGTGDDVIIAGVGNDVIRTGTGNDVVLAGSGDDTITITSTAGTKTDVTGGAGNDTYIIDQLDGNVVIEDAGQSQDVDTLVFDKKHLSGVSLQKSDQDLLIRFSGLAGVVTVKNYFVEDQQSRVEALQFGDTKLSIVSLLEASTETLSSSTNNLAVVGTEEDDVMISGSGDDVLSGNEGDDTLIGGQGDDILTGGSGHDRFVMGPEGGNDTITDFEAGSDTLDMTGHSASFASMKGMTYFSNGITQNGNDVQVALKDGSAVTLEDQTVEDVNQASNFAFDIADRDQATDGNDRLVGTSANDQMVGGKGHDVLTGGAGSDTFTITKHAGDIDTVTDFNVAEDTLDMTQMDEYIDYLQLDVSQKNGDTVISTDDQHIILENVKTKELLEKNFKFAMFDGMPEVQRYQGQIDYDFSLDDTVEADTEFSGEFGANIDPQLFEEAIQSGIDFNSTNFDTVDNAFNEGVTHVLSNNEYWKKVGGKRKRWELQRDTTFNGSNEGWRYTGGKWRRKSHYENGNDRMYGAWWSETINAGSGNDEVYAGNGNDTVNGGSGNDYLDGQDGNDTLNGGSGHDYLLGGRGDDRLNGGTGNDYLDGGQGNDTMYGGDGSDKIVDLEGDNLLSGQHGNDHLISGDGNDTLYGGQGNDHLVAGGGDDVLNGDYDIVSYKVKKSYSYGWGKWRRTYTRWETVYKENDQYGNDILDAGAGDDLVIDKGGDNVVDLGDGNDKAILGIGNDTIDGGTGDDHITAGAGNDTIHTGSDDDYAQADAGNDLVEATNGLNWLHGGSGNDKLIGGVDHDIIYGGSGDDIIEGNDGSDLIVAGTNDDTVSGGDGADDISLGQGDDTATGDAGDDLIKGEDGQDTIDGGDGHDSISGGQGADRIKGGAGNDLLSGDEGDDVIDGQDGSDFLYGGDGNDRLIAGEGKNILRGDAGDDIYVFNRDDRFRDIVIGFEAGDKIDLSSYTEYVSLRQIQRDSLAIFNAQMLKLSNGNQIAFKDSQVDELQESNFILNTIEGSTEVTDEEKTDESTGYLQTAGFFSYDAPDSVTESNWLSDNSLQTEGGLSLNVKKFSIAQSGNAWNNTIAGHDGAEWLLGGGGDDWIDGQGGSDIIDGGTGSDSIYGGAGNDIVSAGAGNDLVYGGEGNDMLTGNDGNDILSGEAGDDVIHGNNDHDFISGGEGNDKLYGDAGNDFIEGNNGNDTIFGGDGNDLVYAGLGNDTIDLGSGNDFVSGGGGRDRMEGKSGDDILHGDAGHDALFGGDGNDTLDGGDHNDIVKGDQGNDVLAGGRGSDLLYDGDGHDTVNGGDGDDVLFIGNGSDRLSGGQGRDIFSFESLASSTETDWDILLDFTSGDDQIDLSTVGIESMADLSMTSEGGDTIVASVALDVDFMFKLSGVHRLTDDDFVFAAQA